MRTQTTRGLLAATIVATLPAFGVHAETPEEVLVTAKRLEESIPQDLSRYGSRMTTVTAADVTRGGYNDVSQVLQNTVAGLYIAPSSGAFSYVDASLQGSRSGDILWLVDGVRINNRLYSTTMPLDTVPAHMIERIEVLEGGQGLFYGTQAIAGVVNIITREFTDQADSQLSVGADTNDGFVVNGYARGAIGKHRLVVFGSKDKTDGFQPFRDQDYQPSATDRDRGYNVVSAGAKYAYDFSDDVRVSASYQHTDADIELLDIPQLIAKNVNSRDEDLLSAKLDYRINDHVDLYLKGYYHDWDTTYVNLYNSVTTPGQIDVIDPPGTFWGFNDKGANAVVRLRPGNGLEYYAGYDLQKYGGRDESLLIAQNSEQTQAVFAQIRATPELIANTHLSAGVRYNSPSDAENVTVWTATGQYDFTRNLFVRGVVGTGFRLPSAEELYAIDPFELGNPNLKPEASKNLNLCVGGTFAMGEQPLSWELIGFHREVTNLIEFEFDEARDLDVAANVPGRINFDGGELVLSAPLTPSLSARASYTFNKAEREDTDVQIQRIPKDILQAALDYHSQAIPLGLTVVANHAGDVYANIAVGPVEYGNYTIVDLSGSYLLGDKQAHRLGLRLENAFDEDYGRPATGRTDVGDVAYAAVRVGTPRTLHVTYTYGF